MKNRLFSVMMFFALIFNFVPTKQSPALTFRDVETELLELITLLQQLETRIQNGTISYAAARAAFSSIISQYNAIMSGVSRSSMTPQALNMVRTFGNALRIVTGQFYAKIAAGAAGWPSTTAAQTAARGAIGAASGPVIIAALGAVPIWMANNINDNVRRVHKDRDFELNQEEIAAWSTWGGYFSSVLNFYFGN